MRSRVLHVVIAAWPSRLCAQAERVATIDTQRALEEVEDGRRARMWLRSIYEERRREIDAYHAELAAFREEILHGGCASEPVLADRATRYRQLLTRLIVTHHMYEHELVAQHDRSVTVIVERLGQIAREVARARGYTRVVERSDVGTATARAADLTDRVIRAYDRREPP